MQRPRQLACMILNPLDFWLWGHLKTLVYSALINDLEIFQEQVENSCQEIQVKQEFSTAYAPLWDEELKVVLKCMGTTQSIFCRNHKIIAHTSAGIGLWT
jgi:hypothetical protein